MLNICLLLLLKRDGMDLFVVFKTERCQVRPRLTQVGGQDLPVVLSSSQSIRYSFPDSSRIARASQNGFVESSLSLDSSSASLEEEISADVLVADTARRLREGPGLSSIANLRFLVGGIILLVARSNRGEKHETYGASDEVHLSGVFLFKSVTWVVNTFVQLTVDFIVISEWKLEPRQQ